MLIPNHCVYYKSGDAYVYTYDQAEGVIHEVPVEVGIYDADKTEITDGLTTEDDVIITWSSELFEGSQVEILGETAGADTAGEADGASTDTTENTTEADAK